MDIRNTLNVCKLIEPNFDNLSYHERFDMMLQIEKQIDIIVKYFWPKVHISSYCSLNDYFVKKDPYHWKLNNKND